MLLLPLVAAVSITDFGAIGDGQTVNTQAITDAIAYVAARRGGLVHVPPGVFLTGPVNLTSDLILWLARGAVIRASWDSAPVVAALPTWGPVPGDFSASWAKVQTCSTGSMTQQL